MTDWLLPENEKQLRVFYPTIGRFESLEFSGNFTTNAWRELAIVLAEECRDLEHAKRAVDAFLRTIRLDSKGYERTDIPSAPELRKFVKEVPAIEPPTGDIPAPCAKCFPNDGRWQIVMVDGVERAVYCDCDRAAFLSQLRTAAASRGSK